MDEESYLIRYGFMSHVGRFPALPSCERSLERGQLVVIQTDRGLELGEVLIATEKKAVPADTGPDAAAHHQDEQTPMSSVAPGRPHVLRAAGPDDLSRSRSAMAARSSRFSLCQRILEEGNWPWELVDVEPLLDGRATVLHYLGPHHLDAASLRAQFRVECAIDVVLEPVGADVELSEQDAHADDTGGCGSCGCGDGGGCGNTNRSIAEPAINGHGTETADAGCASSSHSGCSTCGIGRLMANRRHATA